MAERQNGSSKSSNLPVTFRTDSDFRIYMVDLPESTAHASRKNEIRGLEQPATHVFGPGSTLVYDEFGKPWPSDSHEAISVTHASARIAMIVSGKFSPGIDIELERPELENVRSRLLHFSEADFLGDHPDRQWVLQVIWGAKEAVYKSYGKKKLVFREDMIVQPFGKGPETEVKVTLKKNDETWEYSLKAEFRDEYYLVYTTACRKI